MNMQKKTIHRSHWKAQLIEVIDEGDLRSLIFGGSVLQSAMFLSAPQNLALSYTRYMMASLLLDDEPQKILVVGVGAGSLVRFLYHHFPEARIDATDISASVIDLASHFFHLPKSTRVTIHCCDGRDFLHRRTDETNYDLILIDAFDAFGMAETIYNKGFFENCLDHLSINGIVSLNMWSGDQARMAQVAAEITYWYESVVELPVPNRGNVVCLAGRGDITSAVAELDENDILRLQERFSINFQEIFRVFRKYNLSFIQRLSSYFN
jgi:spermidine synthase